MKLICPSCGAVHSAEAWQNDPVARQCLKLVSEMPHAVGSRCFAYLALFRKQGNSLRWKTVLNLLFDLKTRASKPYVQWKGQVARPSSAAIWGQAMDRVIENPPPSLPLKTHGYLRSAVYDIANNLDRKTEVKKNQSERDGSFHPRQPSEVQEPERITGEEMKAIRRKNFSKKIITKARRDENTKNG